MTYESISACKDEMTRRASFSPEKLSLVREIGVALTVAAFIVLLFIGCALIGF